MRLQRFRVIALLLFIAGLASAVLAWRAYHNTRIIVEWSTASELETAGFNLLRSTSPEGLFNRVNEELIPPSPDPLAGGDYTYTDTNVEPGRTYYYHLEEVELSGSTNLHGPIQSEAQRGGLIEALLSLVLLVSALLAYTTPTFEPAGTSEGSEKGESLPHPETYE